LNSWGRSFWRVRGEGDQTAGDMWSLGEVECYPPVGYPSALNEEKRTLIGARDEPDQ
jgi:hypothetical protein